MKTFSYERLTLDFDVLSINQPVIYALTSQLA